MSAQLNPQQVELLAMLTELGHVRPALLSLIRGGAVIGPIPIIRVTPGFLGTPGGHTYGWPAIATFLNGVQEVFCLVFGDLFGGGQSGEGEVAGESVGGVEGVATGDGGVEEGELRLLASMEGVVEDVSDSSSSSSDEGDSRGLPSWLRGGDRRG